MLAQIYPTTQAPTVILTVVPEFVTTAYAWGQEDGAQGEARRGILYWFLDDPRQAEYNAGYAAGCLAAGRPNRYAAFPVDFGQGQ